MGLYPKQSDYRDYRFPTDHYENRIYHVSAEDGDDNNSGLSWEKAKLTIMAAVNLARYEAGGTTINYTDKGIKSLVLVAPGHYNERVAWSGYGLDLVGCGHGRPGKDYGVSINYDQALTLADDVYVVAFGGSGNSIRNLYISCDEAMPGVTILAGDNNLIENCVIHSDNSLMTYGIHATSLKGTEIRDCIINGFATAGIWFEEGADRYAIEGGIFNNRIHNDAANADGILFDGAIVARGDFVIAHNFIDVLGGGAGAIGIDINYTGIIFVTENFIRAHTDAIDHSGEGNLNNYVSEGAAGAGTASVETGDA